MAQPARTTISKVEEPVEATIQFRKDYKLEQQTPFHP